MMLRVDFHCHTKYSRDSLTSPERLLDVCRQRGLDRLVVTDHNTIAGALAAQKLDPYRVIIGEEIMTTEGELLAFYVNDEVPAGLTPEEAISRLRSQGAFISVSHPFDVLRSGHWSLETLLRILPLIDAIEIFNARCLHNKYNTQAQDFAHKYKVPGTAGSDAHADFEIGRASLVLPEFSDANSLKISLAQASLRAKLSPAWVHLASTLAKLGRKR